MVLAAIHWEPPPARYSLDRGGVWPRTSSDYSHACTRTAMLIDVGSYGQTLSGFSGPQAFRPPFLFP